MIQLKKLIQDNVILMKTKSKNGLFFRTETGEIVEHKKFYKTPKEENMFQENQKMGGEKRKEDPNYFKRYNKDRASYYKSYHTKKEKGKSEKVKQLNREAQRRYNKTEKRKKAIKEE